MSRAAALGVVALVVAMGGCSAFDSDDAAEPTDMEVFCDLATPMTLEARVQVALDEPPEDRELLAFLGDFYAPVVDAAPSEIKAEVETADGLYRRAVDGDATVLEDPALASTSDAIAEYVDRACPG